MLLSTSSRSHTVSFSLSQQKVITDSSGGQGLAVGVAIVIPQMIAGVIALQSGTHLISSLKRNLSMESPASKSSTARTNELPPRRGRVKREIFGFLANSIVSAAVRAGGTFGRKVEGGGGSSSSTATPPTSGYTSDQNNESS